MGGKGGKGGKGVSFFIFVLDLRVKSDTSLKELHYTTVKREWQKQIPGRAIFLQKKTQKRARNET